MSAAEPTTDHFANRIICGDALHILRTLPSASVDCVVTDPPYSSLDADRCQGTTTRLGGHRDPRKRDPRKWFETIPDGVLAEVVKECYRVLKPHRHCYVMCDYRTLRFLDTIVRELFQHVSVLVWDKETPGMGYHYRRSYEFVLMLDKGRNRRLNDLAVRDVLRFRRVQGNERSVPTQKPVALCELLIRQSTDPGDIVLDPFAGSGTTCLAARHLGRRYIGIEREPAYVRIAEARAGARPKAS
jgi:site-specific DNA-methyltransferase (adenine-specific)